MKKFFAGAKSVARLVLDKCRAYLQKTTEYAKLLATSKLSVKLSAVAASVCLVAVGTVTVYGLSMNYGVSFGGEIVAYVEEKEVVDEAVKIVADILQSENTFDYIKDVNCVPSLLGASKTVDSEAVAQKILEESDDVAKCGRLVLNGETYLCASSVQAIKNAFDARLASFATGIAGESVAYLDAFEIIDGYCLKENVVADSSLADFAAKFSVKTIKTVTYTESIAFKTINKTTSQRDKNYKRVTKSGVNGQKTVTARIETVNGVEQSRQILSEVVTKQPVDQIVVTGTAPVKSSTQKSSKAGSFIWPLAKAERQYISSYFGDGRGHKGWDICSPKGTPIYASKSGTVTTSGWSTSGYGKYIIIDHGNGYSTLYSHCSELYVKVGQKVTAGETIAAVGMTGRASGNHLHFEIRINGVAQNPNRYF